MAALPVEILYGLYLGLLTGIIPALVSGALGFLFKYFTGVTIPGFGVVVLAVAIAGVNGGLLALNDPTIIQQERLLVALLVVLMLSLYAHSKGDQMGAAFPRKLSLRTLRDRRLSTDVVELVGGRGQVRVKVVGSVGDIEGYPPLPPELRATITGGEWTFPADIPLTELEARLEDRLRSEYDLAEIDVRMDERARASVVAAPPVGGISKRVPVGERAVSIDALVPTGVARGDVVTVRTDGGEVRGTVVSAKSTQSVSGEKPGAEEAAAPTGGATGDGAVDGESDAPATLPPATAPVTTGGSGRVTVAVGRADAETLLGVHTGQIVVESRGTRREYELLALLRRSGNQFRRVAVGAGGPLDGNTLREASVREEWSVVVLGRRHGGTWRLAPRGDTRLAAGDELFVVGSRDALERFEREVA